MYVYGGCAGEPCFNQIKTITTTFTITISPLLLLLLLLLRLLLLLLGVCLFIPYSFPHLYVFMSLYNYYPCD